MRGCVLASLLYGGIYVCCCMCALLCAVPRPTTNGEIWVYNKGYTQYIPVSLYDLQTWMSPFSPAIYVFDCNAAGLIMDAFTHFMRQRREKLKAATATAVQAHNSIAASPHVGAVALSPLQSPSTPTGMSDLSSPSSSVASPSSANSADPHSALYDDTRQILLCACGINEILPLNPELPADLFTSCLTTPIKMALRWWAARSMLTNVSKRSSSWPAYCISSHGVC